MACETQCSALMQSYFLYSAILALKLMAMVPLASFLCNPDKVYKSTISDLKQLTVFWVVAALYITTAPDQKTALSLLRMFAAARFVTALDYVYRIPRMVLESAFFASLAITSFMGAWVIYTYRMAV